MDALVVVDVQNDFCPGGALPVPDGHRIVSVINQLMHSFPFVVATQDWHPANHKSFAANHAGRQPGDVIELAGVQQILWPVHCVQGTKGAEFHPDLNRTGIHAFFQKGTDPEVDSYSGFFDNARKHATGLHEFLQRHDVTRLFVCGLATDYCVKFTCLDGRSLGYDVFLVMDASRGVDLHPGDVAKAIREMEAAGVILMESSEMARLR